MPENKKGTFRDLFKSFKYAKSANKLLVALIAVIWFNLLNYIFFGDSLIIPHIYEAIRSAFSFTSQLDLPAAFTALTDILHAMVPKMPEGWTLAGKIGLLTAFYLAVWVPVAFLFGIITRITAVEIARDEKISLKEAIAFSARKYFAFFLPIILVFAAFLLLGLCFNLVIGLVGYIPFVGEILVPLIGFPISLVISFVAVMILTFGLLGFPLMGPVIAVEGQDSFDAISRSYHYSVQRLGKHLSYIVLLLLFLFPCVWFCDVVILRNVENVSLAAFQAIPIGENELTPVDGAPAAEETEKIAKYNRMKLAFYNTWPYQANYSLKVMDRRGKEEVRTATDKEQLDKLLADLKKTNYSVKSVSKINLSAGESAGGFILAIWLKGLRYLVGAFILSFLLSGATIIYYTLRKQIDGAEFDEVYIEGEDEEFEFGEIEDLLGNNDDESSSS